MTRDDDSGDDDSGDDDSGDDDGGDDDSNVRCSAAALDLAVPADGTLRPLERLDGRWTCMSMPQHVNLIAYGGQFTDATWPSFGRRRRLLRRAAAAAASASAVATECTVAATECTAAATEATVAATEVTATADEADESAVARAVMRAVRERAVRTEHADGGGGGGGGGVGGNGGGGGRRRGFWRRLLSRLVRGLFRLPSLLAKRRVRRRRRAPPRFKCTTL